MTQLRRWIAIDGDAQGHGARRLRLLALVLAEGRGERRAARRVDEPTYKSEAQSLATPWSESSDALTSARELDLPEAPRK